MTNFNSEDKSELFQQLTTMENAGIPLIQSIETLLPHTNTELNKALLSLLTLLKQGKSFSAAGLSSGIFSDIDSLLIQAATDSGKLGETFKRLASQYDLQTKLKQTMKSRMVFPVFVFTLAVFIAPIPKLVTSDITTGQYLNITVFFLIKFCLLLYILFKLPYLLRKGFLKNLGLATTVDNLILKVPVFGKYYIKNQITKFIETLGMLLEAGIPAFEALPKAAGIIDNLILKLSFDSVVMQLQSQATLTNALASNPYISKEGILHIKAGEASGRLYESLNHYGKLARRDVTSAFEQFSTWLPRIIYGIVCLYMANVIFNSGAFLPNVNI